MSEQPDLGELLRHAQEVQEQLTAARAQAASTVVEGVAGGGMVKISMLASGDVQRVTISPEVVDPGDVGMLEDLVTAAMRDVLTKGGEAQQAAINEGALGQLGGLGDLLS